jgi:hypothetical protein
LPQRLTRLPFQIDHIIAEKHQGPTVLENLALACLHCNSYKGPCIAGRNRETGEVTRPFNPRTDNWHDHFTWDGPRLVGKTDIGRVTIDVLKINLDYRLVIRAALIAEGEFPPAL